ncbi:MAG: hypothetical protein Q7S17_08240 [Xanthobacteraceae bacterium]|nr:hypothetical protein [Xanthobacteraceae bacterium]
MAARKTPAKGSKSDKRWRDALALACLRPADGGKKGERWLDRIAMTVVKAAADGDIQAAKEIGDRLDGKPAQAVVGADGGVLRLIAEVVIVDPKD